MPLSRSSRKQKVPSHWETLDGLEKNEKLSKENKMIIQEYLRILIKERLETNDSK